MSEEVFSFHLVRLDLLTSLRLLLRRALLLETPGLLHAECLAAMELGAPMLSASRLQLRNIAVFAQWESDSQLDSFLAGSALGRKISKGWHVRLQFLRKWGHFPEIRTPRPANGAHDDSLPVVAVTIARLKIPEVLRFFRWGRPVEEQVRDHPGQTLAMASFRCPRTFSTFSIWRSQKEMTEMVHGTASLAGGPPHADAMAERNRRDFHIHFATYRFRALSEHGQWRGRGEFVPRINLET